MDIKKVLGHEFVYLMVWMLVVVTVLNPLIVMILSPPPTGIPPRYLEILGGLLSPTDRECDIYWFPLMIPTSSSS